MLSIRSIMKNLLYYFLFGLISVVQAQESDQNSGDEGPKRTFSVTCWGEWDGPELFVKEEGQRDAEGKWHKLALADLAISPPLPFEKGSQITLYQQLEGQEGTDDEAFKVFARFKVPSTVRMPLLVLFKSGKKIQGKIFDLSPDRFPGGSYVFVNLGAKPLQIELNNKKFNLKPGQEHLVRGRIKKNQRVQIRANAMNDEGKLTNRYSSMLINRPNKRMVMFFFPTTNQAGLETISCRSVVDFVQGKS